MQVLIGFAHTLCKAGCGIVLNVLMECCRRDENYKITLHGCLVKKTATLTRRDQDKHSYWGSM